ncbi:MAG: hypothetical protein PVJ46_01660 [Methyloceanibacter sp.]|jgi:hypothetical protein
MKKLMIALSALALMATPAFADDDPSEAEVTKIKEVLSAWGCEGGSFEKETEGSGIFEAEDVKCKDGQYDFRLGKDFKVIVITAD